MERKTTIYDIARLAGASTSTVSAALSGSWKARRISAETAETIQRLAHEHGYRINMQARALRKARSGLAGMILPLHDNRFFASLSQSFEAHARARGLCPVVASTLRDPQEERRMVESLISHAVETIFVAGATDPAAVAALCGAAGLRQINIDLPSDAAPSVVTDNYAGARVLTEHLLDRLPEGEVPWFVGGTLDDDATRRRAEAFCDVLRRRLGVDARARIVAHGYSPRQLAEDVGDLVERLGGVPAGLFVNSSSALEGVLFRLGGMERERVRGLTIACYDYDPIAAFLFVPVLMVRQDVDALIATAFDLLDRQAPADTLIAIEPELIVPGSYPEHLLRDFG